MIEDKKRELQNIHSNLSMKNSQIIGLLDDLENETQKIEDGLD